MEFYKGALKTWQGLRRPPSILGHVGKESCPVIFGHVQGHEQSLLVSTDEGNENSKANLEEVAEVVSVLVRESFLEEEAEEQVRLRCPGLASTTPSWPLRSALPSS